MVASSKGSKSDSASTASESLSLRVRGDRAVKFGGEGLGAGAGFERGAVSAVSRCIWGGEEAGEEGVLVTGGGM